MTTIAVVTTLTRDGLTKACVPCRDADAGLVSAPRGVTGEALQAPEGTDGLLRLATVRPGEEIRDPAVPVHAGESGAGHRAESVRDAGARTHTRKNEDADKIMRTLV